MVTMGTPKSVTVGTQTNIVLGLLDVKFVIQDTAQNKEYMLGHCGKKNIFDELKKNDNSSSNGNGDVCFEEIDKVKDFGIKTINNDQCSINSVARYFDAMGNWQKHVGPTFLGNQHSNPQNIEKPIERVVVQPHGSSLRSAVKSVQPRFNRHDSRFQARYDNKFIRTLVVPASPGQGTVRRPRKSLAPKPIKPASQIVTCPPNTHLQDNSSQDTVPMATTISSSSPHHLGSAFHKVLGYAEKSQPAAAEVTAMPGTYNNRPLINGDPAKELHPESKSIHKDNVVMMNLKRGTPDEPEITDDINASKIAKTEQESGNMSLFKKEMPTYVIENNSQATDTHNTHGHDKQLPIQMSDGGKENHSMTPSMPVLTKQESDSPIEKQYGENDKHDNCTVVNSEQPKHDLQGNASEHENSCIDSVDCQSNHSDASMDSSSVGTEYSSDKTSGGYHGARGYDSDEDRLVIKVEPQSPVKECDSRDFHDKNNRQNMFPNENLKMAEQSLNNHDSRVLYSQFGGNGFNGRENTSVFPGSDRPEFCTSNSLSALSKLVGSATKMEPQNFSYQGVPVSNSNESQNVTKDNTWPVNQDSPGLLKSNGNTEWMGGMWYQPKNYYLDKEERAKRKERYREFYKELTVIDNDSGRKKVKFECKLCGTLTARKDRTIDHIESKHFNIRSYVCDCCSAKFPTYSNLSQHRQKQHGIPLNASPHDLSNSPSFNKGAVNQAKYKELYTKVHDYSQSAGVTFKKYCCKVCHYFNSRADRMILHIETHHRELITDN